MNHYQFFFLNDTNNRRREGKRRGVRGEERRGKGKKDFTFFPTRNSIFFFSTPPLSSALVSQQTHLSALRFRS
jgi:hypothetical protein